MSLLSFAMSGFTGRFLLSLGLVRACGLPQKGTSTGYGDVTGTANDPLLQSLAILLIEAISKRRCLSPAGR